MENARLEKQFAFAQKHGWADADLFPLAADASTRSYIRLVKPDARCLMMDAPPATEKLPEYLKIAEHLQSLGLRVPQIYAADTDAGLALIEDFGDETFTRLLAGGHDEKTLYLKAADVLVHIHRAGSKAVAVDTPNYSVEIMLEEVGRFLLWFVPAARGTDATAAETKAFTDAWSAALEGVAADNSAFVFRDFHVDNLMLTASETGPITPPSGQRDNSVSPRCGLLDFQDALKGPPAYDMASLLEDARRDIAPATRSAVLDHYLSACEHVDRPAFLRDMTLLAAQRHTKVAGIFVRLSVTEKRHAYLDHLPRVMGMLKTALADSNLQGVGKIMEAILPGFTEPEFTKPLIRKLT